MYPTRLSVVLASSALFFVAACGDGRVEVPGAGGEGSVGGDCRDGADNDEDGLFDCDDDGCAASPDCEGSDENAAPSGAAIAIEPATPGDGDDLSCTIVTEATDPNGDALTYRFGWARNGADAGVDSATVGAALTSGGDTWACTVTPNDGALDGAPASVSVTITQGNEAPSAPGVSISPAAPTDDDVLTCVIDTESVDPDGDAVTYSYAWSVNGVDAGVSAASVNAALTEVGQAWTCVVTASDGEYESSSGSASVEVLSGCGQEVFEAAALALGATGFWSMDETSGSFLDSVGGADAVVSGTVTRGSAGLLEGGLAATFPGGGSSGTAASGFATAPVSAADVTSLRTVVAWVNPDSVPATGVGSPVTIRDSSGTGGVALYASSSGDWHVYWSDTSHHDGGGGVIRVGETAFIATTLSGSTATLYVDGEEVVNWSAPYTAPVGAALTIGAGRNFNDMTYGFDGVIDGVAIFPSALSATDIADLYAAGCAP